MFPPFSLWGRNIGQIFPPAQNAPKKTRISLSAEPLKSLEKMGNAHKKRKTAKRKNKDKTVLRQASAWNRFWRDFLEVWGGSEANFLELCFGRFPYGNFHTKATSKKFGPPSGNFRPNPPELPRSPSMSFSSREAGWRTVLKENEKSKD